MARIRRKIMTKREKLWRGVWRGRGWGFFAFSSGSSAIPRARVAGRISSFPALVPTTGNPFPERSVPGPGWFYEMGDSREGEGGPDRVPLAHHEVRRSKAGFLFVPREKVDGFAKRENAGPFDSPGVELTHYKENG